MRKVTSHKSQVASHKNPDILVYVLLSAVCGLALAGCGYSTKGFAYKEKSIFISPVVNNVGVTDKESRAVDSADYPVLLEKRLTNGLIGKFNGDGNLAVVSDDGGDSLKLYCGIKDYRKESVRSNATDSSIQEQKLDLDVSVKLIDPDNKTLMDTSVTGETSYFLSGSQSKSEAAAQDDLVDDTSRRILDSVTNQW